MATHAVELPGEEAGMGRALEDEDVVAMEEEAKGAGNDEVTH
jgi:hypothetical protein